MQKYFHTKLFLYLLLMYVFFLFDCITHVENDVQADCSLSCIFSMLKARTGYLFYMELVSTTPIFSKLQLTENRWMDLESLLSNATPESQGYTGDYSYFLLVFLGGGFCFCWVHFRWKIELNTEFWLSKRKEKYSWGI